MENDKKPLIEDNFPELKGQEKNFEVYSQLYQFEKNFQSGNDLASIKTTIESYLLNDRGFKTALKIPSEDYSVSLGTFMKKEKYDEE